MYLKTSEQFAEKYQALIPIIETVDSMIVETETPILVPDTIAAFIGTSSEQVEAVLRHHARAGTLEGVETACCANEECETRNETADGSPPASCSGCGGSSFGAMRETIYRLTPAGTDERSRVLGGLSTKDWPTEIAAYRGRLDTVIVSIKPEEFAAVAKRLVVGTTVSGRREWNLCRVWSEKAQRAFLVAIVRANGQGNVESYSVTRDAIDDLDPTSVLVVGIGGAVPGDLTLGDVVFGRLVHDLTLQESRADGQRRFSIKGEPLPTRGQNLLSNLVVTLPQWLHELKLPTRLPPVDMNANVAGDSESVAKVLARLAERYGDPPKTPAVPHFVDGEIASRDDLIKDPDLVAHWRQMAKHILAVDMESAGACKAARDAGGRCIVFPIRAISDVIGLERNDEWTRYACEVAAAFALAFVRSWQAPPK